MVLANVILRCTPVVWVASSIPIGIVLNFSNLAEFFLYSQMTNRLIFCCFVLTS